jgi:hypothetical protein
VLKVAWVLFVLQPRRDMQLQGRHSVGLLCCSNDGGNRLSYIDNRYYGGASQFRYAHLFRLFRAGLTLAELAAKRMRQSLKLFNFRSPRSSKIKSSSGTVCGMIFQVGNRDIVFQELAATALNRRFIFIIFIF